MRIFASLLKQSTSELCIAFETKHFRKRILGEVAEWSIAAVLKTVVLRGTRGSNPCLSAIKGVNQVITRFTPFFYTQECKVGCFRIIYGSTDFPSWQAFF